VNPLPPSDPAAASPAAGVPAPAHAPPMASDPAPAPAPAPLPATSPTPERRSGLGAWALPAAALGLAAVSLAMAWQSMSRLQTVEQEVVRRQEDLQRLGAETHVLAKRAEDSAREAIAKAELLQARVAEVAVQRGQLEDLIQSLSRSRDENLLVDIEAALRVSQQQSALTGSAEPLVATLRQADERLARYNQPRLEGVRRAIARDLERVRAVGVADVSGLVLRLDEVVRLVDELPLLAAVEQTAAAAPPAEPAVPRPAAPAASAASAWWDGARARWADWADAVWDEARSLVRITRVTAPEAMLLAPEHAFYLRENLKLRILNARLALLSRQFDTARVDLQSSATAIERYFDPRSRRTTTALEVVRQVATQSRQVPLPRPDDTLAALATAAAGR
jgi:uroporphyrin-III C-methyltransferase